MAVDLALAGLWLSALALGLGASVLLHSVGLPRTAVRDLLHVGAGVWVLGWPSWRSPLAPCLIVLAAALGALLVPRLARRSSFVARFQASVSGGDERWSGIVLYTVSFAALTRIGFSGAPFPAAAALLALSLGDGIGGAVGRRLGRIRPGLPGGRTPRTTSPCPRRSGDSSHCLSEARLLPGPLSRLPPRTRGPRTRRGRAGTRSPWRPHAPPRSTGAKQLGAGDPQRSEPGASRPPGPGSSLRCAPPRPRHGTSLPGLIWSQARREAARPLGPIHFAHSDLSGLSIFEEAQYHGLRAAEEAMEGLGARFESSLGG